MTYPLHDTYTRYIPDNGHVLDVGCFGFRQIGEAARAGKNNLHHFGVDYGAPPESIPAGFTFRACDLNKERIPFADDSFDLVVASHVIEHLHNPVEFFGDCVRVCKPGGYLYFEAPSERALWFPGFPFKHDSFFSLSFYDDPTHALRPWTPQAFHRLSRYYHCEPVRTGYRTSWKQQLAFPLLLPLALLTQNGGMLEKSIWYTFGWASYLVVQKPATLSGQPPFRYYIPSSR